MKNFIRVTGEHRQPRMHPFIQNCVNTFKQAEAVVAVEEQKVLKLNENKYRLLEDIISESR